MFDKITKFIGPRVGHTTLAIKSHAPELLLGGGVVAGVASVVMTAKAHKKSDEAFATVSEGIEVVKDLVHDANTDPDAVSEEQISKGEEQKMLLPLYLGFGRRGLIL